MRVIKAKRPIADYGFAIAGVSLAALGLGLLYETAQQAPWPVTAIFSGLYAGFMVLLLGLWLDS